MGVYKTKWVKSEFKITPTALNNNPMLETAILANVRFNKKNLWKERINTACHIINVTGPLVVVVKLQ